MQWWEDYIKPDGTIGRRRESTILGYTSELTLRQAQTLAEENLHAINQGKAVPYSNLTLREFVEQFFVPLAFPILKLSTRKRYRSTLDLHLLPAFGSRRLRDISTADLQRFVLQKFEYGLGWETCCHVRSLFSKIFASAKKWGRYGGENPATGVDLPEKRPVQSKWVLTPEQIPQLLVLLREPVRTMVLVGILTGRRVGEILGLYWEDLDLERGTRVERAIYRGSLGTPKTKGSKRTLPLPGVAIAALKQQRSRTLKHGPNDLVFPSRKGTPFSDTNLLLRDLKPAGAKMGAPWLSWHTLRRTHATLLQVAGGSAKDAQAQLGHARITTTLGIYTLPLPAHQRAAVDRLSELVTNGDELRPSSGSVEREAVSL